MNVPTLIVLGAAGGLLREAVDLYSRLVSWRAERLSHRRGGRQAPLFSDYFDPTVDLFMPVVHIVMGAGATVLFGTTGQISGEYAALVVGMSAPMLLTQLTRVETVNDALTADRRPAETAGESAAPSAIGADGSSAAAAAGPGASPPRTQPRPPHSASPPGPAQSAARAESPLPTGPMSSPRPPTPVARAQEPAPDGPPGDRTQLSESLRSGDTPFSTDPADGAGSGLDGGGAQRWQQRTIGEEGA
ncbi:hypothetical protein EDD92_9617 [Streptomyces sp. TLI_185]|nr:hypothetical protein EDD92_9617 [Streptomyces sp. TLI_185]